jgi:putative transposase
MPCRRKRLIHHSLLEQDFASSRVFKILHLSHAHVKVLEGLSDAFLIEQIRALAFQHKRYGYRRICLLRRRQGILIGLKRLKRLWKKERLQLKKRRKRPRKPGVSILIPEKAQSPNHVWTVDFVHVRCSQQSNQAGRSV